MGDQSTDMAWSVYNCKCQITNYQFEGNGTHDKWVNRQKKDDNGSLEVGILLQVLKLAILMWF